MKTVLYVKHSEKFSDRRKLAGVSEYARAQGWNLQAVEKVERTDQLTELIRFWKPSGIIVNQSAGTNRIPPSLLVDVSTVFFHYPIEDGVPRENCVFNDAKETAAIAARELLTLNLGQYAFVGWDKPVPWSESRKAEFARIMTLHGKNVSVFAPNPKDQRSDRLVATLKAWLKKIPRPVGVFAANDRIAVAIVSACNLARLSIPDDVAVIGVDNDEELCEGTHPSLSSVEIDFFAAGQLAAETLDKLMSKRVRGPLFVRYPPYRVVRRESTRRLARLDRTVAQAVELIRREACNGLTASEVITLFDCSRRMAEIRFRAALGRSILCEIRNVRLETAKTLLINRTTQLGFVANRCGYRSLAAFSVFFRAETGVTPSGWRNGRR